MDLMVTQVVDGTKGIHAMIPKVDLSEIASLLVRPPLSRGCSRHNDLRRVAPWERRVVAGPAVAGGPRRDPARHFWRPAHPGRRRGRRPASGSGTRWLKTMRPEIGRRYLQARGEAARHFGPGELDSDFAMRRLDNRAAARRAFVEETGRRFRRWLQGFAAGINRYVATHRDDASAVDARCRAVGSAGLWPHVRCPRGVAGRLRRLLEKYPRVSVQTVPDVADPTVRRVATNQARTRWRCRGRRRLQAGRSFSVIRTSVGRRWTGKRT